jgi:peroxiredoxin
MTFGKILISISLLFVATAASAEPLLIDFSGKTHKLDQYTGDGRWTVVMLWAHDCHVCNQEIDQYKAFHDKHKDSDAHVLGISVDGFANKPKAEKFISRHEVNFPSLLGEPMDMARMYFDLTGYNWRGTPTFLIYAPDGELVIQQVGAVPTPLIEKFMTQESHKYKDAKS